MNKGYLDRIHDELYELLVAFDNLCSECKVNYSLHGGTLIGAMRYGDFIPWDDDADITMLSGDYIRLKKYIDLRPELGYRLVDSDGISCRFQRIKLGEHTMCWIDIIEYNNISENKICQKIKICILLILYAMGQSKEHVKTATREKHGLCKLSIYRALYLIGYLFGKKNILRIHAKVRRNWFVGKRTIIHRSNDQAGSLSYLLPIEYYSEYQRVLMHGYKFMVTANYDDVLTQCYGTDWMVPPNITDQIPHESTVRRVYEDLQAKYEKRGK